MARPTHLAASVVALVLLLAANVSRADQLSVSFHILVVEVREEGPPAVYFSQPLPDAGCSLIDRALLMPNMPGSATLLQATLGLLQTAREVQVRIDGCYPISPGSVLTAPRITKLTIRSG